MTQATEVLPGRAASHGRIVGVVSSAHFVSHFYFLLLAPLLPYVRAEYAVSYTELGIALSAFNIVSAVFQTPTGFLVDRLGARILLVGGLVLGGLAFIGVGLVHSFWIMVVLFAFAGLANTVYHPADYAMLSHHVPANRMGQAFSIHSFAGLLGSAVAPAAMLLMQSIWGWRGAFIAAGVMGLAVAAVLFTMRAEPAAAAPKPKAADDAAPDGWKLLLSAPILWNFVFFILLSTLNSGMFNYSVVALQALYGTPVSIGNTALSAHLLLAALGVLVGGVIASRFPRHALVTIIGLLMVAALQALIGGVDLGSVLVIAAMGITGLFSGITFPSRDMIVKAMAPPGSVGKVFGFVTTGFNVGGIVAPLMFGAIMDHGSPQYVFLGVAATSLLAILIVATGPKRAN